MRRPLGAVRARKPKGLRDRNGQVRHRRAETRVIARVRVRQQPGSYHDDHLCACFKPHYGKDGAPTRVIHDLTMATAFAVGARRRVDSWGAGRAHSRGCGTLRLLASLHSSTTNEPLLNSMQVIVLSHSGNTSELASLPKRFQAAGCCVVSVVGDVTSRLATASDFVSSVVGRTREVAVVSTRYRPMLRLPITFAGPGD